MVSQDNTISIKAYADSYLDEDVKLLHERHLIAKKFPEKPCGEGLDLLRNKLKRRELTFSSKIWIVGPSDNFLAW